MMQSPKDCPGCKKKKHCFHSNHDWLLIIIATSLLGATPSALWDWDFPSGENLAPSAVLTHRTSKRKAYLNMRRANKRLCSHAGSSRTVGCGPNTSPLWVTTWLWYCKKFYLRVLAQILSPISNVHPTAFKTASQRSWKVTCRMRSNRITVVAPVAQNKALWVGSEGELSV